VGKRVSRRGDAETRGRGEWKSHENFVHPLLIKLIPRLALRGIQASYSLRIRVSRLCQVSESPLYQ